MNSLVIRIVTAFAALMFATDGHAASYKTNRIDIQYVEPYDDFTGPPAQQSNWSPL